MKHAYLILAHDQWDLLRRLISRLDDPRNDIYVHIDAKVRDLPEIVTSQAGLYMLDNRIKVYFGDVSVVKAEYVLFEAAYAHGGYSYYHVMSGVDLPLRSQDSIHSFFEEHAGTEFIGYAETTMTPQLVRKVRRWHILPHQFKRRSPARALLLRIQELLGIYRNQDIGFKKGTQWCSITPDLVNILLDYKTWVLKTFSHTFCADEIFVQTICWNSPFRNYIYNVEDDLKGCLRMINWLDGCLYDWTAKDYETLKNSDALFARKFNTDDPAFLDAVMELSKR